MNRFVIALLEGIIHWEINFFTYRLKFFIVIALLSIILSIIFFLYYQQQVSQKILLYSREGMIKIFLLTVVFSYALDISFLNYTYDQLNKQNGIYKSFKDRICEMELTATELESSKSKDLCNIFEYLNDQQIKDARIPYSITRFLINSFLIIYTMLIICANFPPTSPNKIRLNQTRTNRKSRWMRYRQGLRVLRGKRIKI
jgi:hypothetical protein